MARSKAIKNALIAVLEAAQLNGEPAFTKVIGHTEGEFDSYPLLRVLPGDQSSEKATQSQNDQTVRFIARTTVPLDAGDGFDYMYDLTDLIMDTVNEADFADTLSAKDPTIKAHMMLADRGDWQAFDTQAGSMLACDVNVEVTYSKDF